MIDKIVLADSADTNFIVNNLKPKTESPNTAKISVSRIKIVNEMK